MVEAPPGLWEENHPPLQPTQNKAVWSPGARAAVGSGVFPARGLGRWGALAGAPPWSGPQPAPPPAPEGAESSVLAEPGLHLLPLPCPPSPEPRSHCQRAPTYRRRSLRMPRGRSTPRASRHRGPLRQGLRTAQTCTSCHSPRSPCPWPSSRGAQVSGLPRRGRVVRTGVTPGSAWPLGSGGERPERAGRCPLLVGPGAPRTGLGRPPARRPGAAVQRGSSGRRGEEAVGLVLRWATRVLGGGAPPLSLDGCPHTTP